MGGGTNLRPIAPEAYPGATERTDPQRPKESAGGDWSSDVDTLYSWQAVGLFGGLVVAQMLLAGSTTRGAPLAAAGGVFMLPALPAIAFGYTEAAWAFLGAGLTGVVLGVLDLRLTSGLLEALVIVGVALLLAGIMQSIRVARRQRDDDEV